MSNPSIDQSRRQFLMRFVSVGVPLCFGCRTSLASNSLDDAQATQDNLHKFKTNTEWSWEYTFDFTYVQNLIPVIRAVSNEIGKEQTIKMLKAVSIEEMRKLAEGFKQSMPKHDFEAFKDLMQSQIGPTNTITLIESTDKVQHYKISECLWAKTFKAANAAEFGFAQQCWGSQIFPETINPKIKLIRKQTLMQGADYCDYKYVWVD